MLGNHQTDLFFGMERITAAVEDMKVELGSKLLEKKKKKLQLR